MYKSSKKKTQLICDFLLETQISKLRVNAASSVCTHYRYRYRNTCGTIEPQQQYQLRLKYESYYIQQYYIRQYNKQYKVYTFKMQLQPQQQHYSYSSSAPAWYQVQAVILRPLIATEAPL